MPIMNAHGWLSCSSTLSTTWLLVTGLPLSAVVRLHSFDGQMGSQVTGWA